MLDLNKTYAPESLPEKISHWLEEQSDLLYRFASSKIRLVKEGFQIIAL